MNYIHKPSFAKFCVVFFNKHKIPFTINHKNKLIYEFCFKIVRYISTIYFCDKAKGTTYGSKYKQ